MTTATAPAVESPPKLWRQPIPVLGLTGEYASGKSLFACTICPGPQTLVFDTELSTLTYKDSLGFTHRNLCEIMRDMKPVDKFLKWAEMVRQEPAGKYRVIVLDVVSEIEIGLVDWVRRNPAEFGYTASQFSQSAAIMWGCVKDHWKSVLSDLAVRCETFVFISHMRDVFVGGRPTGKREPKGKDTLAEMATLYLMMERPVDKKGNKQQVPSAVVLKDRLVSMRTLASGEIEMCPTLPPRLPKATPVAIREYMAAPPDYSKLKAGERAEEHQPTEMELQQAKLATAEAERDAESLRSARMEKAAAAQAKMAAAKSPVPVAAPAASTPAAPNGNGEHPAAATPVSVLNGDHANDQQLEALIGIRGELQSHWGFTPDHYKAALAKRNVQSARQLTPAQADEFIGRLRAILQAKREEAGVADAPFLN